MTVSTLPPSNKIKKFDFVQRRQSLTLTNMPAAILPAVLLLLLVLCSVSVSTATNVSLCSTSEWNVTFHDGFDGDLLNPLSWTALNNYTHGRTEKELYLSKNTRVSNGTLILTTKKEMAVSLSGVKYNFTSGWVESKKKKSQAYGMFEVRAKLPSPSAGQVNKWPVAWPAHWLMPDDDSICWPTGGEIDIMEGYRPTTVKGGDSVLMTYHWAKKCGVDEWDKKFGTYPNIPSLSNRMTMSQKSSSSSTTTSSSSFAPAVDWSNEFHTFSVEWKENVIEWYVDGISRYVRTKDQPKGLFIPTVPFYMILNTAMTPWSNATVDVGLPLEHVIDSVTWCERSKK